MVLADLPIPPGFAADTRSLDDLQKSGQIEKYQVTSRQIIVCLRSLDVNVTLSYRLHALMSVKVQAPPAIIYQYYRPETRTATSPHARTGCQLIGRHGVVAVAEPERANPADSDFYPALGPMRPLPGSA